MKTTKISFLTALGSGVEKCQLRGSALLVGLSGGADSVALFRGLCALRDEFALTLSVGHLNHMLRGPASEADAEWVRQLCGVHGVPVEIGRISLDPLASGIEEVARAARHRFLDETASRLECTAIATAHTADDQVETVLHHLFRGTGVSGLRGIPSTRMTDSGCRLVRPMLTIRREEVEGYLSEIGQDFRTDATNSDTTLTRNWLRHQLLPDLRHRFGRHVDASLIRLSEQAAEIEQTLLVLSTRLLDSMILDVQPDIVRLNVRAVSEQPLHLVREAFCSLWERQKWPCQQMGFGEWNRLGRIALNGGTTNLPGNIIARHHPPGFLVLEKTYR